MADQKIIELAELTIPEAEDLLAIVDDVVGSPATKKIEVGNVVSYGRNLIQHSAFFDLNDDDLPVMWALSGTPTLVIAADTLFPGRRGNQITITCTGAGAEGIIITPGGNNWLKILPDTKYTFAIDYKVNANDFANIYIKSYNGGVAGTVHVDDDTLASTDAVRVTFTVATDADADNLLIYLGGKNDGDIVYFSHPKLEQGAIATPYTLNEAGEEIKIIHYYHGYARAYPASDQDDIANSTWTHVTLGTEDYDLGDNFATSQFTVPVTGLYELSGQLTWEATAIVTNKIYGCAIWVDPLGAGADAEVLVVRGSSGPNNEELAYHVSDCLKLNATDEVRLYAFHNDGTSNPDIESGSANTALSVRLVHLDI